MKLNIINTLLLVGILGYLIIGQITDTEAKKQAYVVTGELFAEFNYQKELDTEFKEIKTSRDLQIEQQRKMLIELENKIRLGEASDEDIRQYQMGIDQFGKMEYEINQELAQLNGDYSLKIWDKLNSFIKEYGQENGYDVIFGASGEGNIMYAKDDLNITVDLIAYCNQKYSGR